MGTLTAVASPVDSSHSDGLTSEDKAWAQERERWVREDEARTFEQGREVFEDFYEAVKALARRAYDHGYGFDGTPEPPFDWHADAFAKLTRLGLYADRRVAQGAAVAYNAACVWGQHTKYDDPDDPEFYERQERFDGAEYTPLVLIRQVLSIPEGDLSLPVPRLHSPGDCTQRGRTVMTMPPRPFSLAADHAVMCSPAGPAMTFKRQSVS